MSLKKYINEIIVVLALLFVVSSYFYKNYKVTQQLEEVSNVKHSLLGLKEVVALQKIWGDKGMQKKIDSLEKVVSASKVTWIKKQNKITASYKNLNSKELNKLITKILNTPVSITLLDIVTSGSNYNMEFKCKW